MNTEKIFLLTDEWFDSRGRNVLRFVGTSENSNPVEILVTNVKPVFFIDRESDTSFLRIPFERKQVDLKNFAGGDVDAVYFKTLRDLREGDEILKSKGITTYEADVDPARRYLMERFINAQMEVTGEALKNGNILTFTNPKVKPCHNDPDFKVLSLDIETGVHSNDLYSVAAHVWNNNPGQTDDKQTGESKKVFIRGSANKKYPEYIRAVDDESRLLSAFISWLNETDPDIIIGWHVIGFDLSFLENKCNEHNIKFDIGRSSGRISIRTVKGRGYFATIPGRVVIDGPQALRSAFYNFEDFKLETVARELLGEGKLITPEQNKIKEIDRLFESDKLKLAEYNLQDAVLVSDIFRKTGLINLSIKRAQLSGLLFDELGIMTAAFDHFYLPKIHRKGYVAPNVRDLKTAPHAAGGHVFAPKPGIYDDVILLDFKSLYPTIIQTFKIDPLSRLHNFTNTIETPNHKKFSATEHLLPDFIGSLMEQRNYAKQKGDKYLSQAIKILMNSFYGVMGSYGCRFYHPDLPTAITGTGQWLLLRSKEFIESKGFEVIYGDTDSLFVKINLESDATAEQTGKQIAAEVNSYWMDRLKIEFNVTSHLEMEYEKYYRKFVMTFARSGDTGAKKRYAGLKVLNGIESLEFVGLESVRSDWTRLAKEFQVELYERIFRNKEIKSWINDVVKKIYAGELDDKLVYRKRLRKDVDQYTKNIPPQVKAAKMLNESSDVIHYYITKRGPVPAELTHSDIDYDHYIEKQIKPIADSVLVFIGENFDSIIQSPQLNIFDS